MARLPKQRMSRSKRWDLVEVTIRERGWSEGIVRELESRTGASRRTLYRDRDHVVARLVDTEQATREHRRALFLLDLARDLDSSRAAEKWAPVSSMMGLRSRLEGLDVPPPEPSEPEADTTDADPLDLHLAEVRKLRKDAQSRGSMVAAARLLEAEAEALARITERDRLAREAEAQVASDDEVVAGFAAALSSLPDSVIDQLAGAIAARRQDGS